MFTLPIELEMIASLLVQGRVGEANSRWGRAIGVISGEIRELPPPSQSRCLPALKQILSCQQTEDWVGMADGLRFGLIPAMNRSNT